MLFCYIPATISWAITVSNFFPGIKDGFFKIFLHKICSCFNNLAAYNIIDITL